MVLEILTNGNIFKIVLLILSILTLFFAFSHIKKVKNMNDLINLKKNKTKKLKKKSKFKENIYLLLTSKGIEESHGLIYRLILVGFIGTFVFFSIYINPLISLLVLILIYQFTVLIVKELLSDFDMLIREEFPNLINHMVKNLSSTNDLSIVLYESSKELSGPFRELILSLSRDIMANGEDEALVSFIDKTSNIWLHSLAFNLINYKKNSSKEDIIKNLLTLSALTEKRNEISEKMIADRKPVVIMNYMVLSMGVLIFIGNLAFNPIMKSFLSSFSGIVLLIVGISCMFGTVVINIKLGKQ